ncbi:CHASE2 domain-containing protein [Sulfitobacter alexandrii]|uniref:CHASE2 domain-containing protein n=1 Tax=Sulfitobacter alexandrii TaxID=1917485 RepID=UPI001C12B44A|nr:adenylate/guanylate cyclase domain-containing protein [Sulfitobacter alexandrii]
MRRKAAASGVVAGFLVIGLLLAAPGVAERAQTLVVDAFQRMAPRVSVDPPVAIVDIDEGAIARLGQWPWPRSDIALMVERLTDLGAAAIVFDIVFAEPDRLSAEAAARIVRQAGGAVELPGGVRDGDARLAEAFAAGPVVAGVILTPEARGQPPAVKAGFAVRGADPAGFLPRLGGAVTNLDALSDAAAGIGSFSLLPEPDGVVRRVPLVYATEAGLFPALSVEALRVAQGAGALQLRVSEGEARPGVEALRVGQFESATGPDGRLWLHWSGLPGMPRLSAADLILGDPGAMASDIAGRIVLVGTSAAGLRDLVATPIGTVVPGVEAHAEAIDQIVSGTSLVRPGWAPGAEITGAVLAAAVLAAVIPLVGAGWAALVSGGAAVGALWLAWTGFERGLVLDPVVPSLAILATFLAGATALALLTERERQSVRRTFSLYLAPTVVEKLADDPSAARLDGEAREITILFCDLRGFSGLSEGMDPVALTALLNGFLTPMTDILMAHGATIDKFIGDAIMAFWNAPLPVEEHRRRAAEAAVAMGRALDALNRGADHPPLSIGIGLNTGTCCVGNLGSAQRFAYSAIGDPVNVASRIEALTRFYGVETLAAADTARGQGLATLEVDLVRVKGREQPVELHAVIGDADLARTSSFQVLGTAQEDWLRAWRAWDAAGAQSALARLDGLPPGLLALQRARTARMAAAQRPGDWSGVYDPGEKSPTAPA